MKKLITIVLIAFAIFSLAGCKSERTLDNDVRLPVPEITSVDKTTVERGDTITLTGYFEQLSTVTLGGGFTKIAEISNDYATSKVVVTETCNSGNLVATNIYKKSCTYSEEVTVLGGDTPVIVVPSEVVIMDFSNGDFIPKWTKSGWVEAKDPVETGYDLNTDEISGYGKYEHWFSVNDKDLKPLEQEKGQDGNIPYGNYTNDNGGKGFDLSDFEDPYVSVLINTGKEDICYLSLVVNTDIIDLSQSQTKFKTAPNGEYGHFMKTEGNWIWYSYSLNRIYPDGLPEINNMGLFLRNSWDYGAENYPGFQFNIIKMVVTEGALPKEYVVFDFEDEPTTTSKVTSWAGDELPEHALNLAGLGSVPSGESYYTMRNTSGVGENYKFALKADNGGKGYNMTEWDMPFITFAVNTGESSGYLDLVFWQNTGNKEGEPWLDPGKNASWHEYSEYTREEGVIGNYFQTDGLWEWRTYNIKELLSGIEDWAKLDGKYPDYTRLFDYILLWPRNGWNNGAAKPPYELSVDYVVLTDGLPSNLPRLNIETK